MKIIGEPTTRDRGEELSFFRNKADQSVNRTNFVKALNTAIKSLSGPHTDKLIKLLSKVESQGKVVFSPEEYIEFKNSIDDNLKYMQEKLDLFKELRNKFNLNLELLRKYISIINKVLPFNLEKDFLWGGKGSNIEKLNILNKEIIVEGYSDFLTNIKKAQVYVPSDERIIRFIKAIKIIIENIFLFNNKINKIIKMREDVDKFKEDLAKSPYSKELNDYFSTIRAQFTIINEDFPYFLSYLNNLISTTENSLSMAKGALTNVEISKILRRAHKKNTLQRVLMLTHEFALNKTGGVKTVVKNLSKYLKKDYDVDVIERSITKDDSGNFYYYLDATDYPAFKFFDMSYFFSRFPELKLSLLHVESINFSPGEQDWANGGLDELTVMYPKIPVICTVHSVVRHEITQRDEGWMNYSIMMQDQTMEYSNHFIVLHEFGRKQILHFYPKIKPNQISVIPNGIELHSHFFSDFSLVSEKIKMKYKKKLTLLYVGRLSREKGIEHIIKALPGIKKLTDVELVLVGPIDGASKIYYEELVREIEKKGITENIIFVGSVPPHEQREKVYQKYKPDFAVLASYHESFPLFALEAISHGVPLIVSDVDGPREIYAPFRISDSPDGQRKKQDLEEIQNPLPGFKHPLGVAVDPRSPNSIVDAISWVLKHPKEVHMILKKAMEEIKDNYNWETIAKETGKLYAASMGHKKFISQYDGKQIRETLIKLSESELQKVHTSRIGYIGHFKYSTGLYSDITAEFNDEMIKFFSRIEINLEAMAIIGSDDFSTSIPVKLYYLPALARIIEDKKYDVIIAFLNYDLSLEAIEAAARSGTKIILIIPFWGFHGQLYEFVKLADFVFVFAEHYAAKIRSKTNVDVAQLPYVINMDYKPVKRNNSVFTISYIGSLNNAKKIHLCIKEFYGLFVKIKALAGQHVRFNFYIKEMMGDQKAYGALLAAKEKYDYQDLVRIERRFYSKDEEMKLIASSDVMVLPSSFEEIGDLIIKSLLVETPVVFPFMEHYVLNIPLAYHFKNYPFKCGYVEYTEEELKEYFGGFEKINAKGAPIDWRSFFARIIEITTTRNLDQIMKTYSKYVKENFSKSAFQKNLLPAIEYVQTHQPDKKPSGELTKEKSVAPDAFLEVMNSHLVIKNEKQLKFVRSKIKIASIYALWQQFNLDHSESIRRFELAKELANLGYHVDLIESQKFDLIKELPEIKDLLPKNLNCEAYNTADYFSYNVLITTSLGGLELVERLKIEKHPLIISQLSGVRPSKDETQTYKYQGIAHKYAKRIHLWNNRLKDNWIKLYGVEDAKKIFMFEIAAPTEIKFFSNPYPKNHQNKKIMIFLGACPVERKGQIYKLKKLANDVCNDKTILYIVSNNYPDLKSSGVFNEEITNGKIVLHPHIKGTEQFSYYKYAAVAINFGRGSKGVTNSGKLLYYLRGGIPTITEDDYSNSNLVRDNFNGFNVSYHPKDISEFVEKTKAALKMTSENAWDREKIMADIIKNHTWRARAKVYDKIILELLGFTLLYYPD